MRFKPLYVAFPNKRVEYTLQQIKDEPMLFNCDLEHAILYGGPLTQQLIRQLPKTWHNAPLVFDSKSVMLMPEWYPCIPGWHHDDVERKGPHNQPDYVNKEKSAEFIMVLCNAAVAPTQFITAPVDLEIPPDGKVVYQEWDRQLRMNTDWVSENSTYVPDGCLIHFDDNTFHRGVAARLGGWRWFARVSRYYDDKGKPIPRGNQRTNEIRKQVQVYMQNPNSGW